MSRIDDIVAEARAKHDPLPGQRAGRHDPRPHAVYRWFSAAGTLLYIGCSLNPQARFQEQLANREWARQLGQSTTITWYPDWNTGRAVEREAILNEKPLFNIDPFHPGRNGPDITLGWVLEPPDPELPCLYLNGRWFMGRDQVQPWVDWCANGRDPDTFQLSDQLLTAISSTK